MRAEYAGTHWIPELGLTMWGRDASCFLVVTFNGPDSAKIRYRTLTCMKRPYDTIGIQPLEDHAGRRRRRRHQSEPAENNT